MEWFDAGQLEPLPAPFWFIQLFKVLGFTLHMVPMHLWYAGLLVAVVLYAFAGEHGRRFASRLGRQMPVIVALGINLGIVPLLFLQLAYAKAFYPATILMAWFWLAIIALLIPAYYGVYVYAFGLRSGGAGMTPLNRRVGWVAAGMFLVIGFLFANGLSLMTNVAAWSNLWRWHSVGGAATGTALNLADATLWPRWLLMFGLALGTTAVWAVIDATWGGKGDRHLLPARPDGCFAQKVPVTFSAEENEEYKRWARQFAFRVALGGAVWATIAGTWYVFGTWSGEVRDEMFAFPTILLTLLTAASPWFAVVVLWLWRRRQIGRLEAAAIGAVQFAALALNAISRQIVQNLELGSRLFRPVDRPGQFDWGPLMLFLLSFVAGAAVVAWILRQLRKASPAADAAGPSS